MNEVLEPIEGTNWKLVKCGNSRKGFASMTPERRKEVSRKGGKSVLASNRAFSRNKELAKRASIAAKAKRKKPE